MGDGDRRESPEEELVETTRTGPRAVDHGRLDELLRRERRTYARRNPRSIDLFEQASRSLLAGVPMSWMAIWSGGFPLYFERPTATASPTSTVTRTSTSASATPVR